MKHVFKALILMLTSCSAIGQNKNTISVNDFEKAVQEKGAQILDVRRPDEFKEGHLKGAIRANWHDQKEFQEQVSHLDKTKPVYVYCLSGVRSAKAADWLSENGFAQITNLEGGIKAWKEAGKPVQSEN
jgi:rhodanese-related sulfurtransferase